MMKRGCLLVGLMVLLLVSFVVADVGVNSLSGVKWDWKNGPLINSIWELKNSSRLEIFFDQDNSSLQSALILTDGLSDYIISHPTDKCKKDILNNKLINCNGSVDILKLDVIGNSVDFNTSYIWEINTSDLESGNQTWNLTLTVLNDSLAPRVLSVSPGNYSFKKNESFQIVLNYNESESGLLYANLTYDDNNMASYDNDVRGSFTANTVHLNCDAINCVYTFNPLLEMGVGKFFFDSYFELGDKAGNVNDDYLYHIYIDDQKPVIDLNLPNNNQFTKATTYPFDYNISDNSFDTNSVGNFQPNVNCSLYFNNGTEYYIDSKLNTNYLNNSILNADISSFNGIYSWYINCVDAAGWSTQSEIRNITIDRVGPVIVNLTHGNNAIVNNNTEIKFDITDTPSSVDSAWWVSGTFGMFSVTGSVFTMNSKDLSVDKNNLQIYANDTVGNNNNVNYTIYVDTEGPSITLNSPPNNQELKSTDFNFTAVDNYALNMNCQLNVNGTTVPGVAKNGSETLLSYTFANDGNYNWSVTCADGVGNVNTSLTQTVIIDNLAPMVTLISPANDYNTNNTPVDFNYNFVESNTLSKCKLYIDGVLKKTGLSNFTNISLPTRNEAYTWSVNCTDVAGNMGGDERIIYNDNIPPALTNLTHTGSTISWVVNETANNSVYYGLNQTNPASWKQVFATANSKTPSLTISDTAGTYYYSVKSCDQFDYCSTLNGTNFTIVATPSGGSGGGSSSKKTQTLEVEEIEEDSETPAWSCVWSKCEEGIKIKTCIDGNGYEEDVVKTFSCQDEAKEVLTTETKSENQENFVDNDVSENNEDKSSNNSLTGAITGLGRGIKNNFLPIIGILGLTALIGLVVWKNPALTSGVDKIVNHKKYKLKKEEEEIRRKLRLKGILK